MENSNELNPVEKKNEICNLLKNSNYKYEIHTSSLEKDYKYLEENDLCITIQNPYCEHPLYIDLENDGEFTLSYYKWHSHYFAEEYDYKNFCKDLLDILNNEKCAIIINSSKRWLYSNLSNEKIDKNYNYEKDISKLSNDLQQELKTLKGNIEIYYWNIKDNITFTI